MSYYLLRSMSLVALWFAATLALLALAIVLMRRYRDRSAKDRPSASELLTKFKEVHSRGGLSDGEYRTIKTKLAAQLKIESNDSDETS
jgi:uncharacterized membrane protein